MKRIALFVAIAFTTAASVRAQIPNFNSIEYKYGNGVMCEQCGRTNGHNSDCLIGKTQRLIRDYWAKSKTPSQISFLLRLTRKISDCSLNKGVRPVRRKRHKIKQKRNLNKQLPVYRLRPRLLSEPRFRLNALSARRPLRHQALMKHPIFLLTTRGFTSQPVRNISPNLDRTQVRA